MNNTNWRNWAEAAKSLRQVVSLNQDYTAAYQMLGTVLAKTDDLAGADHFSIQGYRRPRIYPDFVVQQGKNKKPIASVLVVESKGKHLKGSEDTKYKRSVADYFGNVGHKVPWQKLAEDFRDNTFRVQVLDEGEYADRDWKDELKKLLEQPA